MAAPRKPLDHTFSAEVTISERSMVNMDDATFSHQLRVAAETAIEQIIGEIKAKRRAVCAETMAGLIDFSTEKGPWANPTGLILPR